MLRSAEKRDSNEMAMMPVIVKRQPILRMPMRKNGRLRSSKRALKDMLVVASSMIEMPTIPPSMTWFGTRKSSRPMAAKKAPKITKRYFLQ